jgi:hypothetical protein
MDQRIESFLKDVLALEGENSNVVREGVHRLLVQFEKQVRDAETNTNREVPAAQRFRKLCRDRVLKEIQRRTAPSTVEHLQIVLSVIAFPVEG